MLILILAKEYNKVLSICATPIFLNMESAFKYVIWEFLEHNLTSETQLLAAILYGTVLMINAKKVIAYHMWLKI